MLFFQFDSYEKQEASLLTMTLVFRSGYSSSSASNNRVVHAFTIVNIRHNSLKKKPLPVRKISSIALVPVENFLFSRGTLTFKYPYSKLTERLKSYERKVICRLSFFISLAMGFVLYSPGYGTLKTVTVE